jgi:hypothetical protein
MTPADIFKKEGYVIIRKFLSDEIKALAYQYCVNRVLQKDFKFRHANKHYENNWDGHWGDCQAPKGSYSMYGDVFMDTILQFATERMNECTNMELVPTYSYWRLYEKDEELLAHKDRPSCEISTTLSLGKNYDNLDKDYMWSIYVKNRNGEDVPINLEDGDMLIYRACELLHWREPLQGNHHAQVFLHYNDKNGQYNEPFEGRPCAGLPFPYAKRNIKE